MRKLQTTELNRLSIEEFRSGKKIPVTIILDNIRSQNNIGSVFRTADAFMIEQLFLCGITATPPHREIHKTALGATESVPWQYFTETIQAVTALKDQGYRIFCIEQTDQSVLLPEFRLPEGSFAVIFGNEVSGIDENLLPACDGAIEIPQFGTKHSLNVSVAVGIVIWDILTKFTVKFAAQV
jgi:23S rRNA (guanosine2251-2'-O)-methyltransferase